MTRFKKILGITMMVVSILFVLIALISRYNEPIFLKALVFSTLTAFCFVSGLIHYFD